MLSWALSQDKCNSGVTKVIPFDLWHVWLPICSPRIDPRFFPLKYTIWWISTLQTKWAFWLKQRVITECYTNMVGPKSKDYHSFFELHNNNRGWSCLILCSWVSVVKAQKHSKAYLILHSHIKVMASVFLPINPSICTAYASPSAPVWIGMTCMILSLLMEMNYNIAFCKMVGLESQVIVFHLSVAEDTLGRVNL